jgi:hypothetical protein
MRKNKVCPSCQRNIAEVDGAELFKDRNDRCVDGKLHCLDCLSSLKCGCPTASEVIDIIKAIPRKRRRSAPEDKP